MSSQERHDWGSMEWLAQGTDADVSLAKMIVFGGAISPLHRHGNANEVIHVLEGDIKQRVGDAWVTMKAGETILVRRGEKHQTRNIGKETALMMISYSSGVRDYENLET